MNYFLRDENGNFCTSKLAKRVWLHWAELRVNGEVDAYLTPTGRIPKYEDLAPLFAQYLGETYLEEDYRYQFEFRCDAWLAKLDRAREFYKKNVPDCPDVVFETWERAADKIRAAREEYGPLIAPGAYTG